MANTANTTNGTGRAHPISAMVSRFEDELKTLRDQPAWSMGPEETRDALVRATRLTARVAELEARLVEHARTVEVESVNGATSTANWWSHETQQTRAGAHRKTKLAKALGTEIHEPVRVALADGRLLVDQAEVIIPAVFNGQSQVLDLGRRRRFYTEPQRIALMLQHGGCMAEGCDAPASMTHAHHYEEWAKGGKTDLNNGLLLCGHHHARAHDPAYTMAKLPEGRVRFHRRT